MTIGITKNKVFYAKAGKAGNKVVYVGSKTGRDYTCYNNSMFSEAFSKNSDTFQSLQSK